MTAFVAGFSVANAGTGTFNMSSMESMRDSAVDIVA
jgi:hypothetical protein